MNPTPPNQSHADQLRSKVEEALAPFVGPHTKVMAADSILAAVASVRDEEIGRLQNKATDACIAWTESQAQLTAANERADSAEKELAEANEFLDESEKRETELYWRKKYEEACIKISDQHEELERLKATP